ncbi:1,2-phenylacetyl-CoA epoxidase subunit PaaD [Prosthecodimorpha staleyi]|uniref:Phenylacetate-CoA oxygenase subunit PaaJ n=1 Tax=Prosthecodimorpha staleyi TaxID=2840188 RepID=A0A947D7H5_9HYPH|nr:1,2-phenylacetyl-CoA epoxidase subunit PaaD [Prosthecodimorpha staleyi]MBT9291788.1 phenylacetate-CoA oxygenase subunit PaaJ [Prosthecodimorpha staleyi]
MEPAISSTEAAAPVSPAVPAGVAGAAADERRARAWAAAAGVVDPEIPVLSIADLGVLRDIRFDEAGRVEAVITPTYSGCPAMNMIAVEIETALDAAGFPGARVTTVLSPAWSTDLMTEAGRRALAGYGIAPPVGRAGGRRALFGETAVACPHCGSPETERISEFGSTACKALYRCRACREPFDYFKCI